MKLKKKTLVTYAVIGALVFLLLTHQKEVTDVATEAGTFVSDTAFRASLPGAVSNYAEELTRAADAYGVSRYILAAIMWRESNGGATLKPQGPSGTGDFTPRSTAGRYAPYMGANGLPSDGQGWGRGLMQIDYGAHNAWVISNPWWEPQVNINKAAEIYVAGRNQLSAAGITEPQLTPAALAAYNAGPAAVLKSLQAGQDPSASTTGGDYASWILSRVGEWQSAAAAYV